MIEHFSKWMELVPMLDYNNEGIAYAFLDWVFWRFGAPVEVFINQVMKFQYLCEKTLINHQMTSQNHPKIDGLVE